MSQLLTPKYLTPQLAAQVAKQVFSVTLFAEEGPYADAMKRRQGHLVILVPSMDDVRSEDYPDWPNYPIYPHLLYEESVGEKDNWEYPFDDIARCKALQLWQGRNDDGQTDSNAHLLFSGDTPYWGGVKRHGLVVGFSGEKPCIDQLISGMTADSLKALGRYAFENSNDKLDGRNFLA
ncbi:hypothetical protein KC865_01380 [Candidatus Kaiserbacteria bacterium]|nr:hypothetical protein [Candidatus Kaiserbacteria bacterium]USN92643.1 MAG: hypothetical protein H6782_02415 [Candidatus Nomurabacteria bacterium]